MATIVRYDSCLKPFRLMGCVMLVMSILALPGIAVPEITDLSPLTFDEEA